MIPFRFAMLGLVALAGAAAAQTAVSEGTYVVDGGSYSATVERVGSDIAIVDSNKRSVYTPDGSGRYTYYNPNTGSTFTLEVLDDHRIAASSNGRSPTVLNRVGGAPAKAPTPITTVDIPASTIAPDAAPADTLGAVARNYQAKAQSDPDNAQAWTACAAAALKRSMSNPPEGDAYAAQMAKVLKLIIVDPAESPCPDAIPPAQWRGEASAKPATPSAPTAPSAKDVERERLREEAAKAEAQERAQVEEFNRQAALRAKADTAKIVADREAGAAAQRTYDAAQAQYLAEKARNDVAVEAARKAQADYDSQMREYRAKYGK